MPLAMGLVAQWLSNGTVQMWAKLKRQHARRLQQIIRSALPPGVRCESHETAFHSLVHLPPPWRADDFAISLARDGVAVSPSRAFAVLGASRPTPPEAVRLAFGGVSETDLRTALARFRQRWEDPFDLSGGNI
jgi:DNA-binding transcriptional MocR family regulator